MIDTEKQPDQPTLVLGDKEYLIADLSQEAQYICRCMQDLNVQLDQIKMRHDQLNIARDGMVEKLKGLVETNDTTT
jgi:hypothetical protein|tara:strand:- start:245 stop:472 length:228 start_codon:yes stop_codon:yes gene_type:complete